LVQQTSAQSNRNNSKGKTTVSPTDKNRQAVDTPRTKEIDADKDGIPDSIDKCPDEKGVEQYDGCPMPDSDNDGIADDLDECPAVAGPIKYKGCPTPDSDGDKINDEDDKCPSIPGYARYHGCEIPDTDGDGVNDDDDKCKDVIGSPNNHGCLETKESKKALKIESRKKKEGRSPK
jgi:hypothetical protein